jgi:D-alanyl-D-alanine dipeptidase
VIAAVALALAAAAVPARAAGLVDVARVVPDAVLDLRYATSENVLGRPLYPVARCLLRRPAAERLVRAAARLRAAGYRLRLYDCYRPLSVQRALWEYYPRRGFVADPDRGGSNHNRGGAVDLGLATPEGGEVEMPTAFDAFGPKAAAWAAVGITASARLHRDQLRRAMEAEGFKVNPREWWHFDAPDALAAPLLDVPLDRLP